jgi:hypothetical protein
MHYELAIINLINRKFDQMTISIDRIARDVTNLKTIDASILALVAAFVVQIKDLRDQLAAALAANDPVAQQAVQDKLDALATDLEGEAASLVKAVTDNTPPVVVAPVV